MPINRLTGLWCATCCAAALLLIAPKPSIAQAPVTMSSAKAFAFLDPADFAPEQLLPAPAAKGSPAEAREMATLRATIAGADPARRARAHWDAEHEDPSAFDTVVGRNLQTLPETWALLTIVQKEAGVAASLAKIHFARTRPWVLDSALPTCEGERASNAAKSYPSGHATLGFSLGFVLAHLMPGRAPAILDRAADYGLSRLICGAHFPSDVEASHVLGTLVAEKLLSDPRLATRIAAARAELATH